MIPTILSVPGERPSPADASRLVSGSPSPRSRAFFKYSVFILVFGQSESTCKPFKSRFPSPVALWLSWMSSPLVFKARCFGASSLLCRITGLGHLTWSLDPSLLRERILTFMLLPIVHCCSWGVVFSLARLYLCFSYPSQCCPFTLYCRDSVHQVFWSFSGELFHMKLQICCVHERR